MYEIHTRRRGWGWWARVVRTTPPPSTPRSLMRDSKCESTNPPLEIPTYGPEIHVYVKDEL